MSNGANLLDLTLSVKASNWRMYDENAGAADAEFSHARLKALERDDRTCQFCGFKAPKYQEVHHRNDDHADNRPQNLVTACIFCHMCQHIGLAGRNKEAVLIWLPELSQDRLHHVVRSILAVCQWADGLAKRRDKPHIIQAARNMAEGARALEAKLRSREADAERLFKTNDPSELANVLMAMPPPLYEKRKEFLKGLRLLPLGQRFQGGADKMPEIVETWIGTGGPYFNLVPSSWVGILRQYAPTL